MEYSNRTYIQYVSSMLQFKRHIYKNQTRMHNYTPKVYEINSKKKRTFRKKSKGR